MKKALKSLFILVLMLCGVQASAANNVSEIKIDVTIRTDGSAYIVQDWRGTFYEGTENYIPINTYGIEVTDFRVSDAKGTYDLVNNWDIKGSFEQKSRKCGINPTDDGIELCFGISDYGENRYAIEYIVHDFIKAYDDYDGCNFMFINPNMNTFPTDAVINIRLADTNLDENNARFWAFGFSGQISLQSGSVVAYTESALSGNNSMIVMLQLQKGLIAPNSAVSGSFDAVRKRAFEGSNYTRSNSWAGILILLCFAVGFIILIAIVINGIKRRHESKQFYKNSSYFRTIPNGGDIKMTYYLANSYHMADDDSLIIGALLLLMINKGYIKPLKETSVGFFGSNKESVSLQLICEPEDEFELRLYRVMKNAAGEDGVLQEKELSHYISRHPKELSDFCDNASEAGRQSFSNVGGFGESGSTRIAKLSERGQTELGEMMGLKKYLLDFSLISERGIAELAVWREYMIYAMLFGIAERVSKELEKVYPEHIPEIQEYYGGSVIIANSYYRSMYTSMQRAMQAQRSSGLGGSSSIGGGGGFSGGGMGGGSR